MATTEIVGSMLPNNGSELTQLLESEHITHALWKQECETAMGAWKAAFEDIWPNLTVNFIPAENSDDGDELLNQIVPGDVYNLPHEKGLGDIRFAMHGPISALAHASFPTVPSRLGEVGTIGGDIHFDPTDSWRIDADTTEMAYSVRRVAAHEVGHSLGLAHYHGNWQPETDANGNPVFNEGDAPTYIGQDYLMFPVSKDSYNLGITIDQITKDALKALYTGSNARTHLDGWDKTWYRWEKIAEEIAKSNNENIVINITYSYMPEGIPILVDRNMVGTEGSLDGCCICCGAKQANMSSTRGDETPRNFPLRYGVGTSCYCGCCPCKPSDELKFRLLKCERMHIRHDEWDWYRGECDATAEESDGMEFTLSREGPPSGVEMCKFTQEHLNSMWDWGGGLYPTPARGCQGYWPGKDPSLNRGDLYLDVDPPNNTEYSEAWGYSGAVCGSNITVPDRPAYTFGETECLGMGILASLCCCRTGYNSDYMKGVDDVARLQSLPPFNGVWYYKGFANGTTPETYREYVVGDQVRSTLAESPPDNNWKTNPVWECVAEDPRSEAARQAGGFLSEFGGETLWAKVYDKEFSDTGCPPALKDGDMDGYQFNACPIVEQLDGNPHVGHHDEVPVPVDIHQVDYGQYKDCDWTYTDPAGVPDGKAYNWASLTPTSPLECSMDCFSFNIRPDEKKYEYQFLQPVLADGVDGRPEGNCSGTAGDGDESLFYAWNQYALVSGVTHSACSPCTYKQGICGGSILGVDTLQMIFRPQIPLKGVMDPVDYYEIYGADGNSQFPVNTNTDDAGFHYIISGQCRNNDPEEPQYFKLLVAGAWKIHCDCQTGIINTGQYSIQSVHGYQMHSACYETRPRIIPPDHANWKLNEWGTFYDVDCGTQAGCKCLGDPSIWWRAPPATRYPGELWNKTLLLENTIKPCSFLDGVSPEANQFGDKLLVTTPAIPPGASYTHVWYKDCPPFTPFDPSAAALNRGCLSRFPRNGFKLETTFVGDDEVTYKVPVGPPCDGVSWTTLNWQNGTIVSSEGIEGSLPGDCAYSEGDKKCWFNPSLCPYTLDVLVPPGLPAQRKNINSFGDGPECGSKVLQTDGGNDDMGIYGGLSCGCGPDDKCASFCETATPVYMFYTGIIEEEPPPEQQPTRMCTYNILADSYAQAYTGNE